MVSVYAREQGDGTGLLLRHVDELQVLCRCHVLSQSARNALPELERVTDSDSEAKPSSK